MTAPYIVDPARLLTDALAESSPDLMRSLLQTMINALLSEHADAVVGAEWGQRSPDRQAQRNGYRHREMDTRVGTIDVAIPKLRPVRPRRASGAARRHSPTLPRMSPTSEPSRSFADLYLRIGEWDLNPGLREAATRTSGRRTGTRAS